MWEFYYKWTNVVLQTQKLLYICCSTFAARSIRWRAGPHFTNIEVHFTNYVLQMSNVNFLLHLYIYK